MDVSECISHVLEILGLITLFQFAIIMVRLFCAMALITFCAVKKRQYNAATEPVPVSHYHTVYCMYGTLLVIVLALTILQSKKKYMHFTLIYF